MKRILMGLGLAAILALPFGAAGCGHVAPVIPTEPDGCAIGEGLIAEKQAEWRKEEPASNGTLRMEYCRLLTVPDIEAAVGMVVSHYVDEGRNKEDEYAALFWKRPDAKTWQIARIVPVYGGLILSSASVLKPNSTQSTEPTTKQ